MSVTFSLLHATYGRPEKAVAAMRMALERAEQPASCLQYIFATNRDDPTREQLLQTLHDTGLGCDTIITSDNFAGSSPAWDAAAKESTGDILIQMQDDLELPLGWATSLKQKVISYWEAAPHFKAPLPAEFFIAVGDGFRKDKLCCTAIMSRARYEQCGEFLHAGYISVFSDDDVTYRMLRDVRNGRCAVIEDRDLVFLHRHHYHDKTVPFDQTYQRENSAEAYRLGAELFAKRNPEAATDGLVTWR